MVKSALERVRDLARAIAVMANAIGMYETFVALMIVMGMVMLYSTRENTTWVIFLLVIVGIVAPLVGRLVRARP